MTDRAADIHYAKVCITQSRHFTSRARGFSFTLLGWAANARRRVANALGDMPAPRAGQMEPF